MSANNSKINISPELGYAAFDSDNHYYEAEDAFTRHLPKQYAKRGIRWIEENGKRKVLLGEKLFSFIPNPTFDPVSQPGCLVDYFKGKNEEGKSIAEMMGQLESISDRPEYRNRDARLKRLDEQGIESTWMFPTLAVGVEVAIQPDIEAGLASFRAFNRWLDEDWGLNYKNRIYSCPIIPLSNVKWAIEELEWAIDQGARVITMRNGPVYTETGTTSPADKRFDPFWARVQEAGIVATTHAGDDGYDFLGDMWEPGASFRTLFNSPLKKVVVSQRAVPDFYAAMICHHLFERFPRLRVASIENGAHWVPPLIAKLQKLHAQHPGYWKSNPVDQFHKHVWVTPFFEDNVYNVAEAMPVERILFGSDWPHMEGTVQPLDFLDSISNFSAADKRRIMRDNVTELTEPA